MSKQGKIIVTKSKKGFYAKIKIGIKIMPAPSFYIFKDDDFDDKECKVEREKGQIKKIMVDGKELPKKPPSSKTYCQEFDKGHNKKILNRSRNMQKADIEDSFDISKTKLPEDTKKILCDFKNVDNYNLKFNKLARFEDGKFEFFKTNIKKVTYQIKAKFSESMIKDISKRYYSSMQKLNLKFSVDLVLKSDWRLIVGLGNESVYETSMTLHHIYGIPYIPGSAIKGVVRSYIIAEKFGDIEGKALKDQGFCDIFGCPKESFYKESRQGNVIFFDAFPLSEPKIKPDIMNPHYSPYYSDSLGKSPPADYHNPNPIFFLTVKETPFRFMLGIKEKNNKTIKSGIFEGKRPLELAYENMQKALSEHGIGAKTAVGYGYMEEVSEKYR